MISHALIVRKNFRNLQDWNWWQIVPISTTEKKISKRGRKRLRYLLFEAAISVVGKNEEFKEIHRYYTTREKNPLKKMQSLITVTCKLIRVFHGHLYQGNQL